MRCHCTPVRLAIFKKTEDLWSLQWVFWWGGKTDIKKKKRQKFKKLVRMWSNVLVGMNDLVIPLLGIYPKEMKSGSQRNICALMFIATLFTIAKIWKKQKCLLTWEWIKKVWYYTQWNIIHTLKRKRGTSLVVQQLGLHAPNAGVPGLIAGQGTRSHMLQLRARMLQLKTPRAATKTQCSQINK